MNVDDVCLTVTDQPVMVEHCRGFVERRQSPISKATSIWNGFDESRQGSPTRRNGVNMMSFGKERRDAILHMDTVTVADYTNSH